MTGSARDVGGQNAPGTRVTVSVCIVTCNQERYVRQCIESVLAGSVGIDIEVLVGDDRSVDGTGAIVAALAAEHAGIVFHQRNDPRMGVCANLRSLLVRARGAFIAVLDGDDYWLPGKLAAQLAWLEADPECMAVYTNAVAVTESGQLIGRFNDVGDARMDLGFLLRRGNFLHSGSVLMRSVLAAGLIGIEGRYIDYRAHLAHACSGPLRHIGRPFTAYRVGSAGSLVAGANAMVRELYWEAIQSVPRERVADDDYARGLADFLRRVFFRALRTRDLALWREWKPRVFAASPHGAPKMAWLTAANILRMLAKQAAGRFRRDASGKRLRVLYPR